KDGAGGAHEVPLLACVREDLGRLPGGDDRRVRARAAREAAPDGGGADPERGADPPRGTRGRGSMSSLRETDPEIADAIAHETERQASGLELIASENFVSEAVLEAMGSVFTNKYAEGYPGRRYYGGCEFTDVVERLAIERAKKLFGAEHVNVQP